MYTEREYTQEVHIFFNLGSGYFAINNISLLESILPGDICDWSILMMY